MKVVLRVHFESPRLAMCLYKVPGEFEYDGMVFSKYWSAEIIQQVKSFPLKEQDVVITGYPKTGG